jgi:hypothetical protein
MRMAAIGSSSFTPLPPSQDGSGGAAFAGVSRTSAFDLTVTTRDGDTVTISASRTSTTGAAAVSTADGDARAATQSSSASLSFTVEGTLDHDELVDLAKVVKLLGRAASGHHADKLLRRLSRPDLDTLSSVSGSVSDTLAVIGGVLAFGPPAPPPPAAVEPPVTDSPVDAQTPPAVAA